MQFKHIESHALAQLNVRETEIKGREYQLPSGVWVPSMTTVLGYFKGIALQEWVDRVGIERANEIKDFAAGVGTRLHSLCEDYLNNKEIRLIGLMPDDKQLFLKIRPYLNRIQNIRYQEAQLYSERLLIAGRTDVIGDFDGELAIIDFKNTTKDKTEEQLQSYFEQETGYSVMYEELTGVRVEKLVTIMVGPMVSEVYVRRRSDYEKSFTEKVAKYHEIHSSINNTSGIN